MATIRPVFFVLVITLVLPACTSIARVSFPSEDGGVVYADVYGQGERGLVLAHGGRFTKESWAEQAPRFAAAGFCVVAFDFRGRGLSRGGTDSPDPYEGVHHDVLAAIRYLESSGAQTVSVVGASFGGWAVGKAVAESQVELDRVVFLATAVDDPELLTGRKLFVVTRNDFSGDGELRLPDIRDSYERAPEPKELVLLDGDAHAQYIFETDQADNLMRVILRFLTDR